LHPVPIIHRVISVADPPPLCFRVSGEAVLLNEAHIVDELVPDGAALALHEDGALPVGVRVDEASRSGPCRHCRIDEGQGSATDRNAATAFRRAVFRRQLPPQGRRGARGAAQYRNACLKIGTETHRTYHT
jgi:hypothetical protein